MTWLGSVFAATFRRWPVWFSWWIVANWTGFGTRGDGAFVAFVWATALSLYVGAMLRFERAYQEDRARGLLERAWAEARQRFADRMATFAREIGAQIGPILREMALQVTAFIQTHGDLIRLAAKIEQDRTRGMAVGIDPEVFDAMVDNCHTLAEVSGFSFEEIYDRAWRILYEDTLRGQDQVDALRYATMALVAKREAGFLGDAQIPERRPTWDL